MKEITINAQVRKDLGKKASRDLRRSGNVPAVVYGVEKDENGAPFAQPLTISQKELAKLIYTPNVYIVNLNIEGKEVKAILKERRSQHRCYRPRSWQVYEG